MQRQLVVFKGESEWALSQSRELLRAVDYRQVCYLGIDDEISSNHVSQLLGQEFDAVVVNVAKGVDANTIGAVVGLIKAAGSLILLLDNNALHQSPFLSYLLSNSSFTVIDQTDDDQSSFNDIVSRIRESRSVSFIINTAEQQAAIDTIMHVATGHAKRPLLLQAHRGRGKSAALGVAAAKLLLNGKNHIAVAARHVQSVQTLLKHAHSLLPNSVLHGSYIDWIDNTIKKSIQVYSIDALLIEDKVQCDLLLIDEAAMIALHHLKALMHRYNRIVFSTTLHGYEGTGNGFAIKFLRFLQSDKSPMQPAKVLALHSPMRWGDNDNLERWAMDALMLNADVEPLQSEYISSINESAYEFDHYSGKDLLHDRPTLNAIFGLLKTAHYQTTPNDLQYLLDDHAFSVVTLRAEITDNKKIIGVALLKQEGGIEDSGLCNAIVNNERRIKGHLVPQKLAQHYLDDTFLSNKSLRVVRIAVHNDVQNKGYGKRLLQFVETLAERQQAEFISSSFAVQSDVLSFWASVSYSPVFLGYKRDSASDSYSVIVYREINNINKHYANKNIEKYQQQLFDEIMHFAHRLWPRIEADTLIILLQILSSSMGSNNLTMYDKSLLQQFVNGQRTLSATLVVIKKWLVNVLLNDKVTINKDLCLVMDYVVLNQSKDYLMQQYQLTGKKQLAESMQKAVKYYL